MPRSSACESTLPSFALSCSQQASRCWLHDEASHLMVPPICRECKSSAWLACVPNAFCLEHFTLQLCCESTSNPLEKMLVCKMQLLGLFCMPAPTYNLSREAGCCGSSSQWRQYCFGNNDACQAADLLCKKWTFWQSTINKSLTFVATHQVLCTNCEGISFIRMNLCILMDVIRLQYTIYVWISSSFFPGVTLVLKQILCMVKAL